MRLPWVMLPIFAAATVLAADIKKGAQTTYSQPVGGINAYGQLTPFYATDAGILQVGGVITQVVTGPVTQNIAGKDGGDTIATSGPGGAVLLVRTQTADGGDERAVGGPGGSVLLVRSQTADGGTERAVGGPGGATLVVRAQAADAGAEFGVSGPGGAILLVRAQGADGGESFGVTGAGGNPVLVQASGGFWDSTSTLGDTCTSTGTNATATVPASSYVSGYCTTAAYVGIGSTCASADGGTIPSCMVRAANEAFYYRTAAASTTIACLSVSGTTNCPLFTKSN